MHVIFISSRLKITFNEIETNLSYVDCFKEFFIYACKHSGCIPNEVGAEESSRSHALQLHYYLPTIDIEPHLPCFSSVRSYCFLQEEEQERKEAFSPSFYRRMHSLDQYYRV